MLTVDSRNEAALRRLILDPDLEVEASGAARETARRIRHFFVRERGWDVSALALYRFRDLAALSEEGEIKLCRVSGRADWARRQDDDVLHLTLADLRGRRGPRRSQALDSLPGGNDVKTVLHEKTLALPAEDWAYIERLVAERYGKVEKKSRESGAQLGAAVKRLLENAYGR